MNFLLMEGKPWAVASSKQKRGRSKLGRGGVGVKIGAFMDILNYICINSQCKNFRMFTFRLHHSSLINSLRLGTMTLIKIST